MSDGYLTTATATPNTTATTTNTNDIQRKGLRDDPGALRHVGTPPARARARA